MAITLRPQNEQERVEARRPGIVRQDDDYAVLDGETKMGASIRSAFQRVSGGCGSCTSAVAADSLDEAKPNSSRVTKEMGRRGMKLTAEQHRPLGILAGARRGTTMALMRVEWV